LQSDLEEKTKGRFSEKWFYTHFKGNQEKPPRIDMLNLFSRYIGFENWVDFKNGSKRLSSKTKPKSNKVILFGAIGLSIIGIVMLAISSINSPVYVFNFCFYDMYKNTPIKHSAIHIEVLLENESPKQLKCDSNGCFTYEAKQDFIDFNVRSEYYKPKSIYRIGAPHQSEIIRLQSNDYALMLNYFANSNIDDWNKRRTRLNKMINNRADIIQMNKNQNSIIQIFDKEEFIRKLSIPTRSLKRINILETKYHKDEIVFIRFIEEAKND
jgi:hypothetical protein